DFADWFGGIAVGGNDPTPIDCGLNARARPRVEVDRRALHLGAEHRAQPAEDGRRQVGPALGRLRVRFGAGDRILPFAARQSVIAVRSSRFDGLDKAPGPLAYP